MMISYLMIVNIIGMFICWLDKYKAIKHKYRISEKFLLLICLMGGCFGFILGMIINNHKTKKIKFCIVIPVMIVIWIIILCNDFIFLNN